MPNIVEETRQFRNALRRREVTFTAQLIAAWEQVLEHTMREYETIASLPRTEDQAERLLRLNVLIVQIREEIFGLSVNTAQRARGLASIAEEQGTNSGVALLKGPRLDLGFGELNVEAVVSAVGQTRTRAFESLFVDVGSDVAEQAKAAVVAAVANGWPPRRLSDVLRSTLAGGAARSSIVARDQTARAYNSAQLVVYRGAADVVQGWTWICSFKRATCAMCWAMHGTNHLLDEEFGSHPGCACSPAPYLGQDDVKTGEERFADQKAKTQRAVLGTDVAYKAYRSGEVALRDFVGFREDPLWGPGRYQRSMKQIRA